MIKTEEKKPRHLIVGVDYDTTFSDAVGIEDVEVIRTWGSTSNSGSRYGTEKQVPSRIAYGCSITWGYHTDPKSTAYCWTKLLLDRYAQVSDFGDPGIRDVDGEGLMQTPPVSERILKVTPLEFWFTIPALWSIRARNSTRDAAVKAGFGSRTDDEIHLVREPEAAAIACLNELIKNGESPLVQVGNGVLDLASYEVTNAFPRPSLNQVCLSCRLKIGGKCGSTSIDRAFHKLMRSRFGDAFDCLPPHKTGATSEFMGKFESAKRDFGTSQYSRTYRFHLKMKVENSDYYDSVDDEVLLTSEDMKSLFDPVVKQIIGLLEQQVEATKEESSIEINTLVVVGGFGESPYLYSKIKEWCPPNIEPINPRQSWEAICLGAAIRGLEGPIVVKKKSKSHIGHRVSREYRPGIDAESDSYLDPYDGSKKVSGYMDWMIARGEVITPETVKANGYWRTWLDGPRKSSTLTSVKKMGELCVDLSSVNFDMFDTKELETPYAWNKLKLYHVEFQVVTVVEDDLGYMHFRAVCHGRKVGEVRLEFGKEDSSQ
ncbi:hypothetical protein B0H63DRAFT_514209 [Podospora didyma]|uniref:Hsp70 protein n=1 Tax=Podospora didyma TaxID=330526 RepID=A0AAE0N4L7_9PEZI|nr:hypothetical protein B0H63DRAFT_514209 [Podospora didyma]